MSRIVPSDNETKIEQHRLDEQERQAELMSEDHEKLAPDMVDDIRAFHDKFKGPDEPRPEGPQELPDELALFRLGFMIEELAEYAGSSGFVNIARSLNELHDHIKNKSHWLLKRNEGGRDLEVQFDSLIDLVYVALGTSFHHGVDFDEGWRRVHEANMKKVLARQPEDSKRGYKFDVVKPKGWIPPDLSDLVKP